MRRVQCVVSGLETTIKDRRPVGARENKWVRAIAAWLGRMGARPNHISLLGVLFAGLSGFCLILAPTAEPPWQSAWFLAAAAFIPFRGLCNLCDGLMAIEGGLKTKSGDIFNDLPDRISDSILLVAAGYLATWVGWGRELGWAAAMLAVLTAYVRVLGGAAGASQQYCGPMAKSHRMGVMGAACLLAALESALGLDERAMTLGLVMIAVGSVITIARRTYRIVRELEAT